MDAVFVAAPAALLLLLLLPVAALAARRRRVPRSALVLRLLVLTLLILSLSGPKVRGVRAGATLIFAVDFSDSIMPQARQRAMAFVHAAAALRGPRDRIGLVVFGADAVLEEAPHADPRLAFTSSPAGEGTDLAQAITTALAALPDDGDRRIVLLTDGNRNRGDLDQALALARSRDIQISVVPLLPAHAAEVLVEEVRAPAAVRVGERFLVRVAVVATTRAQVRLRVTEGHTVVDQRTLTVEPGRTIVTLSRRAADEGMVEYTASIAATPDGTKANNRASAVVAVRGAPVVWYAARVPGVIPRALAAQGLRVHALAPESLPAAAAEYRGTAAVVLDDVPATILSAAQMAALREYVGRLGGGLLAVGGLHSFGVGGYAGTPLEEALPVSMDVRHRLAIPSMAVMLVIDTSGSMGSFGQQIAKVELAKETAQSVVDLLGERDVIGVISFDQEPRWLVRPTEARLREQILEQVARVQAGGGTNMHPAIMLAYDYLRRSQAKVRHVIVLSDGQTDPGDFQGLLTKMAREKITVSAVAIGTDADRQIMENVARWGGGRSYHAKDLYTIPQILTAEALLASRAYIVEERFVPLVVRTDVLEEFGAFPPLRGYIATAPKPAAVLHLVSPQDDPVLAAWQFGSGRAAAFTSDAGPRWSAEWLVWPRLAGFWSRVVRWTISDESEALQVSVEPQPGGTAAAVVDVYGDGGDPVDGLEVRAHLSGPAGARDAALPQSAPGRYEGRIPAAAPGAYALTVTARGAGGPAGVHTTGFVVPYSAELRDLTVNRLALLQIAQATGGEVLEDPAAAMKRARTAGTPADAWPLLVGAGMAAFVGEIALRRIPALGHHLGGLVAAVISRLTRRPSAEEVEADRQYAQADRWKFLDPDAGPSESMEEAAKLYIARLKATPRDESEDAK